MKYSSLFILLAATIITSCSNEPIKSTETAPAEDTVKTVENKIMIPASSYYSSTTEKDTVTLKVEIFPKVVIGSLSYKFHEKDSNKGDFEGKLRGDTLFADYKFSSEGVQSTREIIFLMKDSVAIEGYGNMEEKNGKIIFKNPREIDFANGLSLKKNQCN